MKKLGKLLLVFALLFAIMPTTVHAENDSGTFGNVTWEYHEFEQFLGIKGITGSGYPEMESLEDPDEYPWAKYRDVVEKVEFKLISKVGNHAFEGFSKLKSVYIPGPVRELGDLSFANCPELTTVTIKEGLTTIGERTFMGCKKLSDITLPESLDTIGDVAFMDCSSLKDITFGKNVSKIGYDAFHDCVGLTKITVPSNVTVLNEGAFAGCEGLTDLTINANITSIEGALAASCTNLTNVTIPNTIEIIGDHAFSNCAKLSYFKIPDGVVNVWDGAFQSCPNLKMIYIPASVDGIDSHAFGYNWDEEPDVYTKVEGFTIYGYEETGAAIYARDNGFKFVNHTTHKYDSGKITKNPTCTVAGAKLLTCTICEHQKTEKITASHTFNIYDKCTKCSKYASYINTSVPKMKVKSISKGKGYLTVKWTKNTKVKGYEVRYSTKSNMSSAKKVTISKYKTTSKKITKLKKKTKYYVQIRSYKTVNGITFLGDWSAVKSQTTK